MAIQHQKPNQTIYPEAPQPTVLPQEKSARLVEQKRVLGLVKAAIIIRTLGAILIGVGILLIPVSLNIYSYVIKEYFFYAFFILIGLGIIFVGVGSGISGLEKMKMRSK